MKTAWLAFTSAMDAAMRQENLSELPQDFVTQHLYGRANHHSGAIDTFMQSVAGTTDRTAIENTLPRAFENAAEDADTLFEQELPAVRQWVFREEDARQVRAPVLAVIGERSPKVSPIWQQRQNLLKAWLPTSSPSFSAMRHICCTFRIPARWRSVSPSSSRGTRKRRRRGSVSEHDRRHGEHSNGI